MTMEAWRARTDRAIDQWCDRWLGIIIPGVVGALVLVTVALVVMVIFLHTDRPHCAPGYEAVEVDSHEMVPGAAKGSSVPGVREVWICR